MRFPRWCSPLKASLDIKKISNRIYEIEIHASGGSGSLIFDTVLMRIHECMKAGDEAKLEGENKVVAKIGNFDKFLECLKSFSGMNIRLVS